MPFFLRWFDEFTGELIDELATRGVLDETLIIYVVDNGWGIGFQTWLGEGKGTLYDLGWSLHSGPYPRGTLCRISGDRPLLGDW